MKLPNIEFDEKIIQFKNLILILLIIIDLIFIITITLSNIPASDITFMAYFDLFVCIILFINLISEYRNSDETLLQFIKSHIIDIISIIPFNFIFLRYLTILQFVQVIRVINIKKVNINSFKFFLHNQLLKTLTIILIIYLVLASVILFTLDTSFSSVFESFWYNMVTITAVGYGDITPSTNAGKVIGMLTIVIGVLFVSVFTAATSAVYMEKPEQETRDEVKKYLIQSKKDKEELKQEINELKDETNKLNEKIDELTKILKEKD